jgi:hypothetical protein
MRMCASLAPRQPPKPRRHLATLIYFHLLKLEALARSHDRDGFDCGSEPVNLFFKQTARQHAESPRQPTKFSQ